MTRNEPSVRQTPASPKSLKGSSLQLEGRKLTIGSVIDGLRSAIAVQPDAAGLKAWLGLASGTLAFDEFYQLTLADKRLTFLTIDTTGVCDLTCRGMCYYNPRIDTRRPLVALASLKKAVADAHRELNLKTLVLAGKEPFLNPSRLFELIRYAGSVEGRDFTVGVITNGRHVNQHWAELEDVSRQGNLDFLDISIDSGFPDQHDGIRGVPGTFALAFRALREASQRLSTLRLGVSSVLRRDNHEGILQLLRMTVPITKHAWIVPVQPPPYVNARTLSAAEIISFAKTLLRLLECELKGSGLEVLLVLYGLYLFDAVKEGLFSWDELREGQDGQFYVQREVKGNRLVYICNVLPEYGWRLARITYAGDYLSHLHFLQDAVPERYAIGNIQNESIATLYHKAKLRPGLFWQLVDSRKLHSCRERPCWNNCFGGFTVSENNFLGGVPLVEKPALCLKADADFESSPEVTNR